MRILATIALSFATGCVLSVLLPWDGWQLYAAAALLVVAVAVLVLRKKLRQKNLRLRVLMILFSLVAALLYCTGYRALFIAPIAENCDHTQMFTGMVVDYPVETDSGAKVTLRLAFGQKAVYYGDEVLLSLEPGQVLSGSAY